MRYSLKNLKEAREHLIEMASELSEIKEMDENPNKNYDDEIQGDVEWVVKIGKDYLEVHCQYRQKEGESDVSLDFLLNGRHLPFEDDRIREPILWAFYEMERDKNKNKAFH